MSHCSHLTTELSELKRIKQEYDSVLSDANSDPSLKNRQKLEALIQAFQAKQSEMEAYAKQHELLRPKAQLFLDLIDRLQQNGKKVTNLDPWERYKEIDGKLNGRVWADGGWVPVVMGEVVETIFFKGEQQLITNCADIHVIDGKLNGRVWLDDKIFPVVMGEVVETIFVNGGQQPIVDCVNIRVINGKLNGKVNVGGRWLPVVMGEVVETIFVNGGQQLIAGCSDIRVIDGKLNGRVRLGGGTSLPVVMGEVVETILLDGEREPIVDCDDIRVIDGKLNGRVKVGSEWRSVLMGKVVE